MADINSIGRQAIDQGREAAEQGYETVKNYADKSADVIGDVSASLDQFVRREPWLGLVAAFAVGYLAAQIVRRMSA
ncbi:MAG TPA: hypothetical protein VJN94_06675 [Candidatus Binataceae bacterium]|nr:hypothetical protein [Candidatus Binataceae bacterium]